jgi:hypothetical protein
LNFYRYSDTGASNLHANFPGLILKGKSPVNTQIEGQRGKSPWADAPKNNWKAELQDKLEKDADRNEAVLEDDTAFFKANPHRRFHIRRATPHERYLDSAAESVLVARFGVTRVRFFIGRMGFDPAEHDNEAAGQELFDLCLKAMDPASARQIRKLEKLQNNRRGAR